ncbi:alpha/beta hydrolase family protein [Flavobacterium gilvum]|uniref:Alpha/beta hydrolase n=1 Tax=Flavobacterium gilvum TaxID=1492737 RepID=A0AAC9N7I7_9FLAO|nr:alpha/beta fold hydrolase [Flavobacterium gilvum]AOW10979.1 alpha/beta hydrolase [Flavobacterium gilvum]
MKKTAFVLIAILVAFTGFGQDIAGQWNGFLKVPGGQLTLVFNISKNEKGYSTTMDSPDQGAKGIPVATTSFQNSTLKFEMPNARIGFEGVLNQFGVIVGTFTQSGQSFPLNLSREKLKKEAAKRPQEPKEPFPYYTEDVTFENKIDKNVLAGTLTLPKKEGKFPVAILISGSGPQNRNEEIFEHKPFLVLADYLTKKGIAVLRFDDRGTGKSTGEFKTATTLDFAKDVQAGIAYLQTRKEIDKNKIGLIGHSEGGMIAPLVAENSKEIDFIVLLAGVGIHPDQLLLLQKEKIERQMNVPENQIQQGKEIFKGAYDIIVNSAASRDIVKSQVTTYLKQKLEHKLNADQINSLSGSITTPWMVCFLKLNPATALEKVKCPVLALNGEKDIQVPADVNLEAIKAALTKGGNKNVAIKKLPNLNHLFQECETGSPNEYATIEQTFSPTALEEISNWVLAQVK